MGFWSFLFGERTRVEDKYFGDERLFKPTSKVIGLGISGKLPGLTTAQKEFYRQVEENYLALIPGIQKLITAKVRNWKPDFTIQDFTKEFWPVYLSIPAIEKKEKELEWEIAFETFHDQNHTFTIYMKGFLPDYVHIDG
ncbi:hypothetical protein [Hymenobacter sp. GOD-10R]|uniref:hypothetical protein n=1 Tax=Hymenobacter sp. GOD-10R TaxID=3093922 RepID=UPI002D76B2E7|nr:hypothetical protein [Hymenobacter sp. GOD-10R]WRQ30143.1 hypothetical protein SD425_07700 [Hymenobacter sp. GOD-10R]